MAASPHLSFRDPDSRTLVLPDRVLRFFTAAGWEKAASTLAAAPIRRRVEAGDKMLLDRPLSWRQRGRPQAVNQAQDVGEQASRDRDLGKLERDIATVADDLGADLDQLLSKRRQRPMLYFLRLRESLLMAISGHSGVW